MASGFLAKDIYKTKEEREEKKERRSKYIGVKLELGIRDMGKLTGTILNIIEDELIIESEDKKKLPILVNYYDVSLLNPLD